MSDGKPDLLKVLEHYGAQVQPHRNSQLIADGATWRPIGSGHLVSDDGRVWSIRQGRLLRCGRSSHGYLVAGLGEREKRYVHELVLTTHDRPRRPDEVARHLNDIKSDNRLCNLKWGTVSQNSHDAVRNGRQYGAVGERHPKSKLTAAAVRDIRAFLTYGVSQANLARWYGVTPQNIANIAKGKIWRSA